MQKLTRLIRLAWAGLITLLMPGAWQDETMRAGEYVPTRVLRKDRR